MTLYLDANIIIYLVEKDPIWGAKAEARIATAHAAGDRMVTSDVSRLECLVGPFILGDAAVLRDYADFFSAPQLHVLPVTPVVWERAARIRATYQFKPLDSLHLAAAVEHGCALFLTNDVQLQSFADIAIEILS